MTAFCEQFKSRIYEFPSIVEYFLEFTLFLQRGSAKLNGAHKTLQTTIYANFSQISKFSKERKYSSMIYFARGLAE